MKKGKTFLTTIVVPVLNAGKIIVYSTDVNDNDFSSGDKSRSLRNFRNYIPFRSIHVVNMSASINVDLQLDYDPERIITCLYNGVKTVRDQPFSAFSIKNDDAVNNLASGDITMEVETY